MQRQLQWPSGRTAACVSDRSKRGRKHNIKSLSAEHLPEVTYAMSVAATATAVVTAAAPAAVVA